MFFIILSYYLPSRCKKVGGGGGGGGAGYNTS